MTVISEKEFAQIAALFGKDDGALWEEAKACFSAAGECDVRREHAEAKKLRAQAASLLEQCKTKGNETFLLLLCDLYRRSEQYEKLEERFSGVTLKDPLLQFALEEERRLAAMLDNDRYRLIPGGTLIRETVFLAPIEGDGDDFTIHLPGPVAPLEYF